MGKRDFFDLFAHSFSFAWRHAFVHGLVFLGFGLLMIIFPQLIVAMIASFLMVIGIGLVVSAMYMRNARKRFNSCREDFFDMFQKGV